MGRIAIILLQFIMRHHDFVLVADCPFEDGEHEGFVMETLTFENDNDQVAAIAGVLSSAMENRPYVCRAVLKAALEYLKRYEVDCKNFVHDLYEKDTK